MAAISASQPHEAPKQTHRRQPVNASQLIVDRLAANGVEIVFGYPGGAILPVYDALYDSPIRHMLVRHEQAAAHIADGYARATGRPGVCMATSGPGAINLATGLATAYMDSVPVVAITGNVPTNLIGTDAFQEADIIGITRPITKHNYLVQDVRDLPRIIDEAFRLAVTGRPGPVLIDIPKDIALAELGPAASRHTSELSSPHSTHGTGGSAAPELSRETQRQLKRVAEAIERSERPVLYIGGGVIASGAHPEVLALAEKANLPTTFTLMGIGGFPGDHPLSLGMLGLHGTAYANYAVAQADLLIAVGARFDDRVTCRVEGFAKEATIVHIDVDAAEIGKIVHADIPVVGDAKSILSALLPLVAEKRSSAWLAQVDRVERGVPLALPHSSRSDCSATGDRGALSGDPRRGDLHRRRGAAPDVVGAVLPVSPSPLSHLVRGPRHDGFRLSGGDRRQTCHARPQCLERRRRRRNSNGPWRAGHRGGPPHPGQDCGTQQQLLGHGPPNPGALIRTPLYRRRSARQSRLCHDCQRLRRRRPSS